MSIEIHPTALVDKEAQIGAGTTIGPYAIVEGRTVIGAECRIGAHAVIKQYTSLGNQNRVHEGAVLGGVPQDLKYLDTPTYLRIGDRNIFREGVTVNRASLPEAATLIGNDNFLMACSHVAHDCRLEDRVVMANCVLLAGHVLVEAHAFMSGGVVIHQFCQIGRHSMIGGNAKIIQDVLPFFMADGVPGRTVGLNRVGLARSGFSDGEISVLKKAYRILVSGPGKMEHRLDSLRQLDSAHVRHLIAFVERSERGFCRAER